MLALLSQWKFSAKDITHFCGTFFVPKNVWWNLCAKVVDLSGKTATFLQSVPIGAFLVKLRVVVVQSEVFFGKRKRLGFFQAFLCLGC